MGVQLAALAELIGVMLKSQQVDAKQILDAVSRNSDVEPSSHSQTAESMLTGNFETQRSRCGSSKKDLGYTVQTGGGEASMPTVSRCIEAFSEERSMKTSATSI